MIHSVALVIADFLFSKDVITEEEKEVCAYGMELIVSGIISVVLVLIIGLITVSIWYAVIYNIMMISLESGSLEYRSGMILLEKSSAYGRKKIRKNQYIANVWFTMIISVAIYAIEFICMRRTCGMPYLNAPLISLTFIGDKLESGTYMNKIVHNFMLNVTIGQFMLAQFIIKLIIVVIIMVVMMWGGRITRGKNKIFTLISMVIAVIYVCVAANSGLLML